MSHTSKIPCSAIPLLLRALLSSIGGSSTSSSVKTHVPQWMPIARLHLVKKLILVSRPDEREQVAHDDLDMPEGDTVACHLLGVLEYIDAIKRVGMHGRHYRPWRVSTNRNQTQFKWATKVADFLESRTLG